MSGYTPLTEANLARLNQLPYGQPFSDWPNLPSSLASDSDYDPDGYESSNPSDSSSLQGEVVREDYSNSHNRLRPFSFRLRPFSFKKCTVLALTLIGSGIVCGLLYNHFYSDKIFAVCAKNGYESAAKESESILNVMDRHTKTPIAEFCKKSLNKYKKEMFGG